MRNIHVVFTAAIGSALIAISAVSAIAYNAVSTRSEAALSSQSQQEILDGYVDQL